MVGSPCVGNCSLDAQSGWCFGCARTRDEIAGWGAANDQTRQEIWAQLPARRQKLGIGQHRLDWDAAQLRRFVAASLRDGGTWTLGIPGAIGEFCLGPDEACTIESEGENFRALSPRGALVLQLGDVVRAFAFGPPGREAIALALSRGRAQKFDADGLTRLGPDRDAAREKDRNGVLYDFGLGRGGASFGLRVKNPALAARLDTALGRNWREFLPLLGEELRQDSPTRVLRSALGRLEIDAKIPPPDGVSPDGPHSHFLPEILNEGRDAPQGLDLPEVFVIGALYYPPRRPERDEPAVHRLSQPAD